MTDVHLGIDVDSTEVDTATISTNRLYAAFNKIRGVFGGVGNAASKAGADIKKSADVIVLAEQRSKRAAEEMRRMQNAALVVSGGMRGFRNGVQNAAFQLNDLSVQLGMGTRASTAFAMQLPQLLQQFGLLGAVIGTLGAVIIPIYRDGFDKLWASTSKVAQQWKETSPIAMELGEAIQFVWNNVEHIVAASAALAALMAGKWVAGFIAARVATMSLNGALMLLRTTLIRLGVGAIVIGIGELGLAIAKVQKATGDWGETLELLGEVASGVWEGIVTSAKAIPTGLAAIWQKVKADFLSVIIDIQLIWQNALRSFGVAARSAGLDTLADALHGAFLEANKVATETDTAWEKATNEATRLGEVAKSQVVDGFEKARASVGKLMDKAAEAGPWFDGMAGAAGDIDKKTGGAAKKMKEMEKSGKRILEQSKAIADQWKAAHDGIVNALLALTSSQDVMDNLGGAFQGVIDSAFMEGITKEFDKIASALTGAIQDAFGKLTGTGLSDFGAAAVGMGIGNAAIGVLNGSVKQVGSGLGSAIGGALGSSLTAGMGGILGAAGGPIGMVLGGLAGGALSGLFGGGRDYTRPTGIAFAGTPLERTVQARESFPDEEGNTAAAHIAYAGVVATVRDFEKILNALVKGTTASAKRMEVDLKGGIDVMKAVDLITLEMDRRPTSNIKKGAEERAKMFESRMLAIVDIAQRVATAGAVPLTQAQAAWREFEAQFSSENVEILKAIGFSAKQIKDAQREVRRDLATGFNKEMLDALVDTGDATKQELRIWRNYELNELEERRIAAVKTAREIGASVDIVQASFRAQKNEIISNYRSMLDEMGEAARKALADIQERIGRYTAVLGRYDQRRSEILTELARRSEEARNAEKTLADARRSLAGSDLAPGGPMDMLKTLRGQFSSAVKSAKGGDAEAAQLAGNLAQQLLQQGRSVYASGTGYNELFKFVNAQLLSAQTSFGGTASKLEKRLNAENFSKITEKSTSALLKGLASVNASIKATNAKLDTLEKRLAAGQAKARVSA